MSMGVQLKVSCDFQGYLVCQLPKDVVEVELKVKTKWGKFTLTKDFHSRTEKYHPWDTAACRARIYTYKHRTPHQTVAKTYESNLPNFTDSDSSTQIITGEGIGYPPQVYTDPRADQPPTDSDIEEQQIPFKDYCRTCISQRPRRVCQPTSDWDEDHIDLTQTDNPANDKDNKDICPKPYDWSDQENYWNGMTYKKIRPKTSRKSIMPPLLASEESDWNENFYSQDYGAKLQSQVPFRGPPPPDWPKGIRKEISSKKDPDKMDTRSANDQKSSSVTDEKSQEASLEPGESPIVECTIESTDTITQEAFDTLE